MKSFLRNILVFFGFRQKIPNLTFTKNFFEFHGKNYEIGDHTYGHPKVFFENKEATLKIGKYCSIAQNVSIFLGGNHRTDWISTYPFNALNENFPKGKKVIGHPTTKGDVSIGNDVWIGFGVTILSGVTVGDGSILAANSTITKNIPPYEVWGGNPAKFIRKRFDLEIEDLLMDLKWWNWNDDKVNQNIQLLTNSPDVSQLIELKNDFKLKKNT